MWRWWILAGLVVMAMGVVASYSGGPIPCIDRLAYEDGRRWFGFDYGLVEEDFHRLYTSRLDVDIGETAWLTMTVQNASRYRGREFTAGLLPSARFAVATSDCRLVWSSPHNFLLSFAFMSFGPHEAKEFAREWSLIDEWGQLVSPGYYHMYGVMDVVERGAGFPDAHLVVHKTVRIGSAQLRAARPRYPPVLPSSFACSWSAGETHIRWAMQEYSETLDRRSKVLAADILDENRMSTGRRGIRAWSGMCRMGWSYRRRKLRGLREEYRNAWEACPCSSLRIRNDTEGGAGREGRETRRL